MPIFIKDNTTCLFIHIPKAGGSSVERRASELGWKELLSVRGINASQLSFFYSSPQHFHAELLEKILDISKIDHIFTICRHPFSRLKSEYYWQIKQNITKAPPKHWIERIINDYKSNTYVYDNHIRPQVEFIIQDPRLKIFKLEENGVDSAASMLGDENSSIFNMYDLKKAFYKKKSVEKKSEKFQEVEQAFEDKYSAICDFYYEDIKYFNY